MNGVQAERYMRDLYTRTDSTSLTPQKLVDLLNIAKDYICQEAEDIDEGFFSRPQYTDLIEGQRLYTLPVQMMNHIEKVSVFFPGWQNYVDAEEVRITMQPWPIQEDIIQQRYTDTAPKFLLRRNSIILLTHSSIPAQEEGLMLWAKMYPSDLTTASLSNTEDLSVSPTCTAIGVPRALHNVWLMYAGILYKTKRDRPIALDESEQNFQEELRKAINSMANQNLDRDITPQFPIFSEDGGFRGSGTVGWSPFGQL